MDHRSTLPREGEFDSDQPLAGDALDDAAAEIGEALGELQGVLQLLARNIPRLCVATDGGYLPHGIGVAERLSTDFESVRAMSEKLFEAVYPAEAQVWEDRGNGIRFCKLQPRRLGSLLSFLKGAHEATVLALCESLPPRPGSEYQRFLPGELISTHEIERIRVATCAVEDAITALSRVPSKSGRGSERDERESDPVGGGFADETAPSAEDQTDTTRPKRRSHSRSDTARATVMNTAALSRAVESQGRDDGAQGSEVDHEGRSRAAGVATTTDVSSMSIGADPNHGLHGVDDAAEAEQHLSLDRRLKRLTLNQEKVLLHLGQAPGDWRNVPRIADAIDASPRCVESCGQYFKQLKPDPWIESHQQKGYLLTEAGAAAAKRLADSIRASLPQ